MHDQDLINALESIDERFPIGLRTTLTEFRDKSREIVLTVPPGRRRTAALEHLKESRCIAILDFATAVGLNSRT